MVLKADWEKANDVTSIDDNIVKMMVSKALPKQNLSSYQIISGGCANLNIKLTFHDNFVPLILRIYLRDKEAAFKEKKLAELIHPDIPVAQIIYISNLDKYTYSIMQFVDGITLRDLLLDNSGEDIGNVLFAAGKILAKMQKFTFDKQGEFDKNLNITPFPSSYDYILFARQCIENQWITGTFNDKDRTRIFKNIINNAGYFPDKTDTTLTHGDYDPANILIQKVSGKWQISAILDWEFAHSGSLLQDVANMLRYSHQLPDFYEEQFLRGLAESGVILPEHWRRTTHLLNLLALLDCLQRYDPLTRPKRLLDIKGLIEYINRELEK